MPKFVIETRDLTKSFGDLTAVNKVSLKIKKGEFYGLLGLNGAGKSTLLNLLTGQMKPDSGTSRVMGVSSVSQPMEVKKKIGIVPEIESPPSFLTTIEYLQYVCLIREIKDIKDKVQHWLEYMDLIEYKDQQGKNLSKGTKQRLMLTGAFIHEPQLLFIDEPFIGLDPYHQDLVIDHLKKFLKNGGTIFMCTHILEIAQQLCTTISIINKGKIVATGTTGELTGGKGTLREAFLKHIERQK